MEVNFDCPHCSNPLVASPDKAGRKVLCLNCGEPVRVPATPSSMVASAETDQVAPGIREEARSSAALAEQLLAGSGSSTSSKHLALQISREAHQSAAHAIPKPVRTKGISWSVVVAVLLLVGSISAGIYFSEDKSEPKRVHHSASNPLPTTPAAETRGLNGETIRADARGMSLPPRTDATSASHR